MSRRAIIAAVLAATAAGQVQAQSFEGDVALSFGAAPFMSTDDDDERLSDGGYRISGWAGTSFGDWRLFGDVNVFRRDIGSNDFDDYAPGGARSLGLHFGRNFGTAYVGAFLGRNQFQSDDTPSGNDYVNGDVWGIEGQYVFDNATFFAQYGDAEMIGDLGDNEFNGRFMRFGTSVTMDKLTLTAEFERGKSPDVFEDGGDWGEYRSFGVTADYQVTNRIIATASFESMDITANSEDNGIDDFYAVGIRVPLGDNDGKRNNLTTSYRPGLAAAWASNLD